MTDRPILRLANGRAARRLAGQRDRRARPQSRGAAAQGRRWGAQFERLEAALAEEDPDVVLRRDPGGIAPERALGVCHCGSKSPTLSGRPGLWDWRCWPR